MYAEDAPQPDLGLFELGLPVLGICYGEQLMFHHLGGGVEASPKREYGAGILNIAAADCPLFAGLPAKIDVWNSHGDKVTRLPPGFRTVAHTENSPFAAVEDPARRFYGLQFHPEVAHTPRGRDLLQNFLCQHLRVLAGLDDGIVHRPDVAPRDPREAWATSA